MPIIAEVMVGYVNKSLKISEAKNGSISVTGLKAELVNSKTECVSLLNKGIAQRMSAQTQMNEASSRSHAIFTIHIESRSTIEQSEKVITSKLHLVDLAGNERTKKTGA